MRVKSCDVVKNNKLKLRDASNDRNSFFFFWIINSQKAQIEERIEDAKFFTQKICWAKQTDRVLLNFLTSFRKTKLRNKFLRWKWHFILFCNIFFYFLFFKWRRLVHFFIINFWGGNLILGWREFLTYLTLTTRKFFYLFFSIF